VLEGSLGPLGVVASLESEGDESVDGYGDTPLEALQDMIEKAE
jgi:hypothetical protein